MYIHDAPGAMDAAMGFLKAAMPLADRLELSDSALERVARHALRMREEMPWGGSIPEDIFAPYVLFPRVNNENPVFYHAVIHDSLAPRLRGLSMADAVLEVNHWCHEQATYQAADARTANALTTMRRGCGRCGEESTLLVCALRACGIPARQLYAPWWSHCDDNHAWVEAWVDGVWHYLGACEPEPALDSGWFTAAASKAMLVHTRAWGVLPAGERAEKKVDGAYIVNRTAAYARTRLLTVQVLENGAPRPGLRVRFEIINMAAWRTLCEKTTDAAGTADLLVGLGTLRVHVTDGIRHLTKPVDAVREGLCMLDFGRAQPPMPMQLELRQQPPEETRIQPAVDSAARLERHARRLAEADRLRQARLARPEETDPLVALAKGNGDVIAAFLAGEPARDRRALVESLREKDLADVTLPVLTDALEGALPSREQYPRQVWIEGVLCPRVADEMLYPVRAGLRKRLAGIASPRELWDRVCGGMGLCALEPAGLLPDACAALDYGWGSAQMRDILFVAGARALGFAARLDPVTGEKQVWQEEGWQPLLPMPTATLTLRNGAEYPLTGMAHFSVARLERDGETLLALEGVTLKDALTLNLAPGDYRVMATARQIDGGIVGTEWILRLEAGAQVEQTLTLPPDDTARRLLSVALPPLEAQDESGAAVRLPEAGGPALVARIAPGQEPTEHFLNELLEARDALAERGVAVRLLVRGAEERSNVKLRRVLDALPNVRCLERPDEAAILSWRVLLNARELRLPLVVAVGRRSEGLFAIVNYNVGSVATLLRVLDAEPAGEDGGESAGAG